jgi:two-component system, chemotaxis family, chemotaxis protein CheY
MDNRAFERLRTLIVDDNQHMINIVRVIMRGFGAKDFHEARDAAEAFDVVKHDGVDLIIVDYQMNLLDGLDFIKLVRTAKDSPNQYVPIIMLTAHSERSRVMAARDAGVTEFCCKPVTALDLYRKIVAVANSPREFVKTSTYFGPDRRRRPDNSYSGSERRKPRDQVR